MCWRGRMWGVRHPSIFKSADPCRRFCSADSTTSQLPEGCRIKSRGMALGYTCVARARPDELQRLTLRKGANPSSKEVAEAKTDVGGSSSVWSGGKPGASREETPASRFRPVELIRRTRLIEHPRRLHLAGLLSNPTCGVGANHPTPESFPAEPECRALV